MNKRINEYAIPKRVSCDLEIARVTYSEYVDVMDETYSMLVSKKNYLIGRPERLDNSHLYTYISIWIFRYMPSPSKFISIKKFLIFLRFLYNFTLVLSAAFLCS